MTIYKLNYTKEEATSLYLKVYRYKILEELRVCEVQRRIRQKLTGCKDEEVDLIFCNNKMSGVDLADFSKLLSEDASIQETNNEADGTSVQETNNEADGTSVQVGNLLHEKRQYAISKKYLDIEAEYSGEQEEEEDDDEYDRTLINDCVQEDNENATIYYQEKHKEDERIMKSLQRRYKKVKIQEHEYEMDVEESDYENEGFSELDITGNEIQFCKKKMPMVPEEPKTLMATNKLIFGKIEEFASLDADLKTLDQFFRKKE